LQGTILDAAPYQPDIRIPAVLEEEELEQLSVTGRSRIPIDDDYARIACSI
jgi:hypothetical protein